MLYEITITGAAERMLKKLARPVQEYVVQEAKQLAEKPLAGSQLEGELRKLRCLRTVHRAHIIELCTK